MSIPNGSNYPEIYDTEDNLFVVHDLLQVRLAEDYEPGDTSITISGDEDIIDKFPPTGIITLTEQCNDPENRATSFYYGSKTSTTFDDLELINTFNDVGKPKNITSVTLNVYNGHHNSLKEACLAIEQFVGTKDTIDSVPYGDTLSGRINYLKKIALTPRAWFSSDKRIGIVPLTVTLTDASFRNPQSWVWDFGDGSTSISGISSIPISGIVPSLTEVVDGVVPCGNVDTIDETYKVITHTYYTPGKYDITLAVGNQFGQDIITIPELITARAPAPDTATITVSPVKIATNQIVNVEVADNGEQSSDPVIEYTWNLGDDLTHASTEQTVAIYSVGGIYDIKLRVDTELGAYRITTLSEAINVVEQQNLWLLAFDSPSSTLATSKDLRTYEFGLASESWKSEVMPEITVTRDYTFTNSYSNADYQRSLFLKNNGFAMKGTTTSGNYGQAIICWAEDSTTVRFKQFEPFDEVWSSAGFSFGETYTTNWNWFSFTDNTNIYMMFGLSSIEESPTAAESQRILMNMSSSSSSVEAYTTADFLNGAEEILTLVGSAPATYKSCYKSPNAFFARNDAAPGTFFRIKEFYRTEGELGDYASSVRKLLDIPGTSRTELQMVSLSGGIYVFNNSGEVAAYEPTTNVWSTGGPGIGSSAFRSLQDVTVSGYSDTSQPLLATSDNDRVAYISYEYSSSAFIKFNESDSTFTALGIRPTSNEQFMISVF